MPFDLGDTVRLTAECTNTDGTPTNATTATLTLTLPDGSTVSPSVPVPATAGQYVLDYPTTLAGRHSVRWQFTDPASAYTDVFDVRPAEPGLILSLADAKAQLNITGARDDEEIRTWLEATTGLIEHFTGITVKRSFTETHTIPPSGCPAVVLRHTPVVSLTSLEAVDGGSAPAVSALSVDSDTGVIRPVSGGLIFGSFRVTYTAGRDMVPASVSAAARIILQHLWQTQRNTSRGGLPGVSDAGDIVPGLGYAIPNRALQLMEHHRLPPGVA